MSSTPQLVYRRSCEKQISLAYDVLNEEWLKMFTNR
jgi:hypothetical protein